MPSQTLSSSPDEASQSAKRRKVRKGTQSCWECKKRKVRCIWAAPTNITCDNCMRRKTACIGQEYPDEPPVVKSSSDDGGVEERLKKVENLLEELVHSQSIPPKTSATHTGSPEAPLTTLRPSQSSSTSQSSKYGGLAQDLIAAWPNQHDLDLIYKLPIGLSTHMHMKLYASTSALLSQEPTSPETMLQLPPPGSHPVLIARKLLLLGSLLQGALSASHIPVDLRAHFSDIMFRVVDTATRLVTRNDELTTSVEGIECIMMEAMIQNYAGNLHRAWMSTRRAASAAQMLGLHRGKSNLSSLKILDPKTRSGLDPDQLCFRIVEMDLYLSMTLGLPQSWLDTCALTDGALEDCHPLDRMARLQCIIARRILSRGLTSKSSENTNDIDRLLQDSAALMPSQWWLVPNFAADHDGVLHPVHDVARTMYQFSHYHLVIRLHLPYMLRPSMDVKYEHNKVTVVHASRETLSRYIAFRVWKNPGHYYCRGVDYLSFIALTALCLAHIDSSQSMGETTQLGIGSATVLAHSRPSDRAMMERTVEILDRMEDDAIAVKLCRVMSYLLHVEAESANGAEYSASTTASDDDRATECDGKFVDEEGDNLQLHIPYLGTINLQRGIGTSSAGRVLHGERLEAAMAMSDQAVDESQPLFSEWDSQWSLFDSSNSLGTLDDWTLQSVGGGLFSSLFSTVGD
ncbi:hypothetical protein BDW02DRAFT_126438 [Decorospora gaudefroyi]|uniref:Zn(2)-C6 fungal-type domain-containing protein n=1 Tax=Decorospora gaudefroyi TaxID=184978 RepID=A0A6A5K0Y8_9PLEO|nr:hypothetical protein BDW02DRAFT_126438 [Decorospora gaudefroyi]